MSETKTNKSGTCLKSCDCKSDFQDKRYGKNIRLCNWTKAGAARCTICEKTH